jgi:predicted metal-dependent hydrolase
MPLEERAALCQVIRSRRRRRTFSIQIRENGKVVCRVPYHAPAKAVDQFLREKWPWVEKKLAEQKVFGEGVEKAFVAGETFLYLGESNTLEIVDEDGRVPLELSFGRFILRKKYQSRARDVFIGWYKKEAKDRLGERVMFLSERLSLRPTGLRITSARARWGSCSHRNRLCFCWRIMMAPIEVIDYVLIHELFHIVEKNHSPRFWSLVEQILPDYKKSRRWLRENGHRLNL